jgi:hypothetical protein
MIFGYTIGQFVETKRGIHGYGFIHQIAIHEADGKVIQIRYHDSADETPKLDWFFPHEVTVLPFPIN